LLLDHSNNVKLVDFGLSNLYKEGQTLKTACGSPCYAAPEMIAGKRYNGQEVDIWSSGVVLFAMVCGYLPFEDPNTAKLYKKILGAQYQIPSFISPMCKEMIRLVLNTDPRRRYTVSQIRSHNWYRQIPENIPSGIVVGKETIPIIEEVFDKLEPLGFDPLYSRQCLDANRHNHVTTTYYLLLKRYQRKERFGVFSIQKKSNSSSASPMIDVTSKP
jgi:5'-AMP-activated protein kinase catalytic alpha subunit